MEGKNMEISSVLKKLFLFPTTLSLVSCCFAPGMRMSSPPASVCCEQNQFRIEPTFIPITPALIEKIPSTKTNNYYYVGPADVLSINVWQHPEFSLGGDAASSLSANPVAMATSNGLGSSAGLNPVNPGGGFLVNEEGDIFFPLIGNIHVAGKTTDQIRVQLTRLLSKYVRHPQIDVRVSAFRSRHVFVMGEVQKSGMLNIYDVPTSITDAINLAGGFNLDTADPAQIYVIRGDVQHPTVYWLNASNPDALLLGERFRLEGNDILFISTTTVARWNRSISQIMPTIQTIWYTQSTIKQGGG